MPIVIHLLAKEFGVPPWVIADGPADEVMQAWFLHCELQPKER